MISQKRKFKKEGGQIEVTELIIRRVDQLLYLSYIILIYNYVIYVF